MNGRAGRLILVGVVVLLVIALDPPVLGQGAEDEDLFQVLQLAETTSGPGRFAFPLFAPIDLGGGYEDNVAPIIVLTRPASNEVDVPIDAAIMICLADYGSGVDGSTVRLLLNDELVSPFISGGLDRTLDVTYRNAEPFEYAKRIEVAISAADFAQNIMGPETFAFTTNTDGTPRPTISISTNRNIYTEGQLLVVLVSLSNSTDRMLHLRGYLAIEVSDTLLFFPTFDTSPQGIDLQLPPGFQMDPCVIWTAPLVGVPEGTYTWYAVLQNLETGDFGQISSAQFEFVSVY
jgi:hypothetical protein